MPEIKFDPFEEEEAFTADSLNDRLTDVAAGINDIVPDAIADGALASPQLTGGVYLIGTVEIPYANPYIGGDQTNCAEWGFYNASNRQADALLEDAPGDTTPGTTPYGTPQTDVSGVEDFGNAFYNTATTVHWDQMGDRYDPVGTTVPQTNDTWMYGHGTWRRIDDRDSINVGDTLEILFNAQELSTTSDYEHCKGVYGILVLLNIEVARIACWDDTAPNPPFDPSNGNPTAWTPDEDDIRDVGPAFCIQMKDFANKWRHIKSGPPVQDIPRTIRTVSGAGSNSSTGGWVWEDVAIRTLIKGTDLTSSGCPVGPSGKPGIVGIRAAISIVIARHDRAVRVQLRNANLSVFLLRSTLES